MKVNWNQSISVAVKKAQADGLEANVTQGRNVVNDLLAELVSQHEPWEILEGIYRITDARGIPRK